MAAESWVRSGTATTEASDLAVALANKFAVDGFAATALVAMVQLVKEYSFVVKREKRQMASSSGSYLVRAIREEDSIASWAELETSLIVKKKMSATNTSAWMGCDSLTRMALYKNAALSTY